MYVTLYMDTTELFSYPERMHAFEQAVITFGLRVEWKSTPNLHMKSTYVEEYLHFQTNSSYTM